MVSDRVRKHLQLIEQDRGAEVDFENLGHISSFISDDVADYVKESLK